MSFLSWLFGRDKRAESVVSNERPLTGEGSFSLEIVGESKFQEELEDICGGRTEDGVEEVVTASLIPEDTNPYENKAIRVDIDGLTVGYLSRENARRFRRRFKAPIEQGLQFSCNASIRGGWDRGRNDQGKFGVFLDVDL